MAKKRRRKRVGRTRTVYGPGKRTSRIYRSNGNILSYVHRSRKNRGGPNDLTFGLMHYWDLDAANAVEPDLQGNWDLDSVGNPSTSFADGPEGRDVVYFQSAGDYYRSPTTFVADYATANEYTINIWVMRDSSTGTQVIINHNSTEEGTYFYGYNDGGKSALFVKDGTTPSKFAASDASTPDREWLMITYVFSPTLDVAIYENGVEVARTPYPTYATPPPTAEIFAIATFAANLGDAGTTYAGRLTLAGIWDRALSQDEMIELYNNGNGLSHEEIVAKPIALPFNPSAAWIPTLRTFGAPVVVDAIGKSNGLLVTDPTWVADAESGGVNAIQLDGVDQYMLIENPPVPSTGSFSVSQWIYVDTTGVVFAAGMRTLQNRGTGSAPGFTIAVRIADLDRNMVQVTNTIFQDTLENSVRIAESEGNEINIGPIETWIHLSVIWDRTADEARFYSNGVLVYTLTPINHVLDLTTAAQMSWGIAPVALSQVFNGRFDDVRYYDRAITQNEITLLSSQRGYLNTNPKGQWVPTFGDGTGTTVVDNYGVADGQLIGGATLVSTTSDGGKFAVQLDGTSGYMQMDDPAPQIGLSSFSIAQWINVNAAATENQSMILWERRGDGSNGTLPGCHIQCRRNGSKIMLLNCRFDDGAGNFVSVGSVDNVIVGNHSEWIHVVILFDRTSDSIRFYADGMLIKTFDGIASIGNMDSLRRLNYGFDPVLGSRYFNGMFDDVRFYNRAISFREVQSLAGKRGSAGAAPAVVPLSEFDCRFGMKNAGGQPVSVGESIATWDSVDGSQTMVAVGNPIAQEVSVGGETFLMPYLDGASGFARPIEQPFSQQEQGICLTGWQRTSPPDSTNHVIANCSSDATTSRNLTFVATQVSASRGVAASVFWWVGTSSRGIVSNGHSGHRVGAFSNVLWMRDNSFTILTSGEKVPAGLGSNGWIKQPDSFIPNWMTIGFQRLSTGDTRFATGHIGYVAWYPLVDDPQALVTAKKAVFKTIEYAQLGDSRFNNDGVNEFETENFAQGLADVFYEVATGGYTIAQVQTGWEAGNISKFDPESVMILCGTNNITGNQTGDTAGDEMDSLINSVLARPGIKNIYVFNETPFGTAASWTAQRQIEMDTLRSRIEAKVAAEPKCSLFDSWAVMDDPANADSLRPADTTDGLHFTIAGYQRLADAFATQFWGK